MKKLLLITSLLFCTGYVCGQQNNIGSGTTIYAFRNYQSDKPASYIAGPVTFNANTPSEVRLIEDQTALGRVYAGEYVNYKWYALLTKPGTQSQVEGLAEIDMNTGKRKVIATSSNSKQLTDMAYDYTTQQMFGIAGSAEKLATIDLKTSDVSLIGTFLDTEGTPVYALALACDLDGQLYIITTTDMLYRVNKETAECTLTGSTEADAAFTQSMGFDHNTHTLYWANNGDYTLYTVDITTGKSTALGALGSGGGDSMNSLFVPYIHVAKGAPDRVLNRKTENFEDKIIISWLYPATDAQGNPLKELTKVYIYRDNELLETLSPTGTDIGQQASYTDTKASQGVHSYGIVCENSKGAGGRDDDDIIGCAGANAPGDVQSFKVTSGDNVALLSWSAPANGAFNGAYNPDDLQGYVINRISDSGTKEIEIKNPQANSYSDETGFGTFSYSITAVNSIGKGTTVASPEVLIKPDDWIIMSNGEYTVTEGKFYDTGGPDGYYKNSERLTMTLKPALPNAAIVAEFTEFAVDNYGDTLAVYDDIGTSGRLIGKYSTSSLPADLKKVVATNADGALTFHFYSDVAFPEAGWSANISCFQKKEYDLAVHKIEGTLYPSQNAESEYTVTLQNLGVNTVSGTDYKIQLIDENNNSLAQTDGVDIASMETVKVPVRLTITNSGTISIRGYAAFDKDNDTANNSSQPLPLNVQAEGSSYISIGDNKPALAVLPASFFSTESLGEMLYNASQINLKKGTLQMISFPMKAEISYDEINLKVWVSETDLPNLNDGNVYAETMTPVFNGNRPIITGDSEWIIPFDTPFEYTGKNLLILIQKSGTNTNNMGITFNGTYGDYAGDKYSCFTSSDEEPLDPNTGMGEYSTSSMQPDIRMLFTQTGDNLSETKAGAGIRIYPNPFKDVIYIDSDTAIENCILSDISGKIARSISNNRINTSGLNAGIYILKINTVKGEPIIRKIIKE